MTTPLDCLVLGAGARGLCAALELRRDRPDDGVKLVEAAARPGGSIRSQRSNGFTCELGPFAFARSEVEPILALLQSPPAIVEGRCDSGHVFDGEGLQAVGVEPLPVSFPSGCEELAQACRRELGAALWLGREVSALQPTDAGWKVTLAGEVESTVAARTLYCGLPVATAANLLAECDPALAEIAPHLTVERRAFVFLGGLAADSGDLSGYGIVPADGVSHAVVEMIWCSNVFERRCLPDRFLARCELAGDIASGDDAAIVRTTIDELRRWTGCKSEFPFTKVHRFETVAHDAAWVECRTRLAGLAARSGNLRLP